MSETLYALMKPHLNFEIKFHHQVRGLERSFRRRVNASSMQLIDKTYFMTFPRSELRSIYFCIFSPRLCHHPSIISLHSACLFNA